MFEKSTKQWKIRQWNLETLACKSIRETSRYCWCTSEGGWLFTEIIFLLSQSGPLKCNDRVINGLFHTKEVKMSRRSRKWENNYFVTSIIWIIRQQRHGKLVKIDYSFDKDQATRFITCWRKRFWFNCLFTLQGVDNSISTGRIERRYEVYKPMIQIVCMFDKILSTQIIFTVRIYLKQRIFLGGFILNRFKTLKYIWQALKYFYIMCHSLIRQLACSQVICTSELFVSYFQSEVEC